MQFIGSTSRRLLTPRRRRTPSHSIANNAVRSFCGSNFGRQVHAAADAGFASEAVENFDDVRPDYSTASIEWLLGGLLPDDDSDEASLRGALPRKQHGVRHDVLDLGAGTGKLSRAILASRPGLRVVGVEPAVPMCVKYGELLDGQANVLQGTAEKIPLLDNSVASVVAGQSFHWFASHAALEEVSRVLKPGGTLGLVWNTRDTNTPWVQDLEDIIAPFYDNDQISAVPRQQSGDWKSVFQLDGDGEDDNGLFEPLQSKLLSKLDLVTEEQLVNHILSLSVISTQEPDIQNEVAAQVKNILENHSGVEKHEGRILLPYMTEVYITTTRKQEEEADVMGEAIQSRVDQIATSALHLDDFFNTVTSADGDDEDEEEDEDFVDYTDDTTGEWNGPTRGGRRPEPTRHGDWHIMGRCTDF